MLPRVKILPIVEMTSWWSQICCRYIRFYIVSKCIFVTDNTCRCRSANMPFYQAKLLLCRFVTAKFSPLVEFAGKSNAAVTRADCTWMWPQWKLILNGEKTVNFRTIWIISLVLDSIFIIRTLILENKCHFYTPGVLNK